MDVYFEPETYVNTGIMNLKVYNAIVASQAFDQCRQRARLGGE
jgi:hypothetical protein